eukprot:c28233_g1_i1 orf=486-2960(-)
MEGAKESLRIRPFEPSYQPEDEETFADLRQPNERFDASQYAFFGNDVSQEIELGGLEEDDDGGQLGALEDEDNILLGIRDKLEVDNFGAASDLCELESSFSKRSSLQSEREGELSRSSDGEPDSISREYTSAPSHGMETPNQLGYVTHETYPGDRNWWPHHQESALQGSERKDLERSHYIRQQQWLGVEAGFPQTASSAVASYPPVRPPILQSQATGQMLRPAATTHFPSGYRPHFPGQPQTNMGGVLPPSMLFGGGRPHSGSAGLAINSLLTQGQWMPQPSMQPGGSAALLSNLTQQQMNQQNILMPPQVFLHHQRLPAAHPGMALPYAQMQTQQLYNHLPSAPPLIPKSNNLNVGDLRVQRNEPQQHGRQTQRYHQQGSSDTLGVSSRSNGWLQFRSKYMTSEEIESIVRIQLAATHSSDPYVDDYYHQAVQAKIASGTPHGRRRFAPSHLRDMPSHVRAASEPHAFLQVDALGRVPFSSVRRPRPLLEVDTSSGASNMSGGTNGNLDDAESAERPLEQEPMLAARVAVEDGMCLLLDIDDIDRLLAVSQPTDGGSQLRRRRQILLDGLAASLQLMDPLAPGVIDSKDDLVFLNLVSLPKGRKLLARYLNLLPLGSELIRIVCMAVLRHLQFFFGDTQTDTSATTANAGLASTVANCVSSMDLTHLSACLAAVVLSSKQPPLRPLGSTGGDGATVILRSVLDRATNLLTDPNATYSNQNRALWQASFDAFFALLSKYCRNKYDSIIHSLMMSSPGNMAAINSAATKAMGKEMPVKLLQASLPHTNEHQRKLLLEFAQRSMVVSGSGAHAGSDGRASVSATQG